MLKRNASGFSILSVLLVLLVIVAVAGCGAAVYAHQNSQAKTIDAVLKGITNGAANTYSNAQFQAINDWSAEYSGTSGNKVAGYDYAVSGVGKGIALNLAYSDKSITTKHLLVFKKTVPPVNDMEQIITWTDDKLQQYGFTTTDNKTYVRGDDTCNVVNDANSLFPNMDNNTPSVSDNSNVLQVTCFSGATVQQAAASMQPFVKEYLATRTSLKASDLIVGPLTVKSKNGSGVIGSSKTAGYDIAEMVVVSGGKKHIALYYAKNADIQAGTNGGWHYVTQANDEFGFSCKAMKASDDSRKAFYDQVCLGNEGQVRLDTNNRALQ